MIAARWLMRVLNRLMPPDSVHVAPQRLAAAVLTPDDPDLPSEA